MSPCTIGHIICTNGKKMFIVGTHLPCIVVRIWIPPYLYSKSPVSELYGIEGNERADRLVRKERKHTCGTEPAVGGAAYHT